MARGIELLGDDGHPVSNAPRVQIVGSIVAGQPIPVFSTEGSAASEEFDTVEVPPDLPRSAREVVRPDGERQLDGGRPH